MLCAACGHENRPGRRFCGSCGAELLVACPACGAANDPGDRFCGECGTPLAAVAAAEPSTSPAAERRVVSVLFADLVGFTTLSEARDPERVRELLAQYFEAAREVIERHGGNLEKFIGDAVVAVWGAPVAQEDDAERAVRAALEIVDVVARLGERTATDLRARAAVSTGPAAVTVGAQGQGLVAGDMVNTTARMQAVAEPGWVLIDGPTRRVIASSIGSVSAGSFELKGKAAAVELHRATRVLANRRGEGRYAGVEPPFVGRERELRLVKELFHATETDRRAHLVHVSGVAGLGKTRLSWEFEKYADGLADTVFWHRGRCLSYGEGVAFWALAEMVRGRARILEDDSPERAAAKLAGMLDEQVTDARTREWVAPALRQLLGLGELEGADRGRLYSAWRMFFEHLADRGTVVLVFEDMQWADEALLDFVEYLLEWSRAHPVFVLALARPELNARRPGWAANRGLTALPLEPLSEDAMRALVAGMVPGLPAEVVAQIAARADGTPLYAVETVRMLLDRGLLRQAGETYEPTGPMEELDVPESLQALVAARLDALSAPERQLVQTAAVLGKSFTAAGVTAISGLPADEARGLLEGLARKDIVQVLTDPFSAERGQYTFVQSTLRTVAYERISHRDRKPLHVATADYLAGVEESTDLSEVIAAHLVDAFRLAPDDPDAAALRDRARGRLLAAADRAASLGAPDEALRLVQRALELAEDAQRARLLEQAGTLAIASERMTEAEELFQRALALLEAAGAAHAAARVRCRLGDCLFLQGRGDEGLPLLDRAYAELAGHPPDEDLAVLAAQVARIRMLSGQRAEAALPALDQALEIAEALELPAVISDTLNTKGLVLLGTPGGLEEGRSLLWGALRVARESGSNQALLRAYFNLAFDCACEDDLRGDEELNREGLALARRLGDRQWESSFLLHLSSLTFETLAWDEILGMAEVLEERGATSSFADAVMCGVAAVKAYRGALDEAERLFEGSLVSPDVGDPQTRAIWSVWRGYLEQARDDDRATMAAAGVGAGITEVIGPRHSLVKPPAVMQAVAAARLGDPAAHRFLEHVERLPAVMRTPLYVAGAHRVRALLGEDPEREFAAAEEAYAATGHRWQLAETLRDHAQWLLRTGRTGEAGPVVERALALYDEAGATVRAAELRGLGAEPPVADAAGTR
jgi:class 3 adenylate cyclase/tetratricopeptide (TPR) repeat protein